MELTSVCAFAATITVNDDGMADHLHIQDAINAAKPGDVIHIVEGAYEEHVEIRKNVHLIGAGADDTFLEFSGENATVSVTGVTDVVISGFTIVYAGPELNDTFRAALWVRDGTCKISENLITGTGQGIRCAEGANVEITGNTIVENRLYGVISYSDVTISQLSNNDINFNGADGIYLRGATVGTLANNIIWDNGEAGIAAFSNSQISQISGNEIYWNLNGGIHLSKTTVETLTDNDIYENSKNAISAFSDTSISQLSENYIQ